MDTSEKQLEDAIEVYRERHGNGYIHLDKLEAIIIEMLPKKKKRRKK